MDVDLFTEHLQTFDLSRMPDQKHVLANDKAYQFESGDNSAARCWIIDQEVVGSNPIHGRNLCLTCVRCLG